MNQILDVDSLSDEELDDEIERLKIERKIRRQKREAIEEVKARIEDELYASGLELTDIYPDLFEQKESIKRKKGEQQKEKKRVPLWHNPDNPKQTSSATGRKPAWLVEAIKKHGEEACRLYK